MKLPDVDILPGGVKMGQPKSRFPFGNDLKAGIRGQGTGIRKSKNNSNDQSRFPFGNDRKKSKNKCKGKDARLERRSFDCAAR